MSATTPTPLDGNEHLPASADLFSDDPLKPAFTARLHTDAPRTLVNSIPMEGTDFIAPFVPCTVEVAREALAFARVGADDEKDEVVVDLGCGDGRVLEQALLLSSGASNPATPPSRTRIRTVGVELDPHLAAHLRAVVAPRYADGLMRIIEANMFEIDLVELGATVLVLYLLPKGLSMLRNQLGKWLHGGDLRRIVTITYSIPVWNCERAKEVNRQWLFYYDAADIREGE
ncbi:hypothetical protein BC830DRAFT_1065641 [Chytriomyces sp. MP71]|nr:hypothetical protein BC830DRAFT_1065641 [Chytriomyces sp. MP71]